MEAGKGVVLLDVWASPFTHRVRVALAEKGVEYEVKSENLWNKSELLLRSNPVHKQIPVLFHDGKIVCESMNIVQYIDEMWSDGEPFMPADPYERAQARFWADYIDRKAFDCGKRLWALKGEAQEQAKIEFVEILRTLEGVLGDNNFFGGETFGYLDIAFIPFLLRFYTYEVIANLYVEKETTTIVAWGKRCMERESVKQLPDPKKIYEHFLFLKKKLGFE